ncbi:hypothetical protein D3C80_939010 [compost metagenome]
MGVAVGETGKQGRALQVDDLHIGRARHRRLGTDRHNSSVADDHLLGGRLIGGAGVDGPATDQQALSEGGGRGGGHQGGGQRNGLQGVTDHGCPPTSAQGAGRKVRRQA